MLNAEAEKWQRPSGLFFLGLALSISLAATGLLMDGNAIGQYALILKDPALLLTDFSYVGGVAATFLNAGLMGILAAGLLFAAGIHTGLSFSVITMCAGFAYFGKTPLTGAIIIAGTIARNLLMRRRLFDDIIVSLFATCMGPMVSYIAYSTPTGWPAALAAGLTAGFLIPDAASLTKRAYKNMNLYNVAFASTIITAIAAEVIRGLGFSLEAWAGPTAGYPEWTYPALVAAFSILGLYGLFFVKGSLAGYKSIVACRCEGADYLTSAGPGGVLINMSLVGLLLTIVPWAVLKAPMTGPLLGTVLAISGWAAAAKKPSAMVPLIAGYIAAFFISNYELTTGVAMGALFVTGLCPLSDRLGPGYGFLAGFIHLFVVARCSSLHGGMMLYNNGLSAGIVAIAVIALYKALRPFKSIEL